ncbi:SRPBCC family protein [Brevibacillus sp. SYSU BS000544]|uniref:SRPBCC family protein n=1 Tax=Brevibacillus sp. SYSU BS000544 TaxID=3416443 RepID=UPI003CE5512E
MNERSAKHATFVIERMYGTTPERVFAAWADPAAKAQWFQKPDEFDFRVGGRETNQGGPPGGPIFTFEACYQEIVAGQRIVYSYSLDMGQTRISVSLVTVEMEPVDNGTRLVFTEQGVFLDGYDSPEQREHGTQLMLDKLGEGLRSK